ncbi:MAG: diadenylate cyclase CdaA [Oscillospiraceae bacterium]|nr:diadenylate cyclase CdaA [Oscillospiraceae bacterium]
MLNIISTLRIQDFLDIIIVAVLAYILLKFIRETRASLLLKGIISLIIVQQVSQWFGFYTLNYILKACLQFGIIAIVVIFQPEIRRALEKVGNNAFFKYFKFSGEPGDATTVINGICDAVNHLAQHRIGSLIVVEQATKLSDVISSGVSMDSKVSAELLTNIFSAKAPLHDGAVVIANKRIAAASCLLPLTLNQNLGTEIGTRHRAAIGITETTDSVVIVTSEETGVISVAKNGSLTRNLSIVTLKKMLRGILGETDEQEANNEN